MICQTKAWIKPEKKKPQKLKTKQVRELQLRIVFRPCRLPYKRVTLSLWPRRVHLPPCFSFSHWLKVAAECHALQSPSWESCYSLHYWQRETRETTPFSKRFDDSKPLVSNNPLFTLEHSSLAPHTGTSSPPYQEAGRGRKNNCTQAQ